MSVRRRSRLALAVLGLPLLLGTQPCSPPPAATPGTSLDLALVSAYPGAGGYYLRLSLAIATDQPIQAAEVKLDWQGNSLVVRPFLDASFDDDGVALGGPLPVSVTVPPFSMADLRHGASTVTGGFGLAEFWVSAPAGGSASFTASAVLARPDGVKVFAGSDTLSFSGVP